MIKVEAACQQPLGIIRIQTIERVEHKTRITGADLHLFVSRPEKSLKARLGRVVFFPDEFSTCNPSVRKDRNSGTVRVINSHHDVTMTRQFLDLESALRA